MKRLLTFFCALGAVMALYASGPNSAVINTFKRKIDEAWNTYRTAMKSHFDIINGIEKKLASMAPAENVPLPPLSSYEKMLIEYGIKTEEEIRQEAVQESSPSPADKSSATRDQLEDLKKLIIATHANKLYALYRGTFGKDIDEARYPLAQSEADILVAMLKEIEEKAPEAFAAIEPALFIEIGNVKKSLTAVEAEIEPLKEGSLANEQSIFTDFATVQKEKSAIESSKEFTKFTTKIALLRKQLVDMLVKESAQ